MLYQEKRENENGLKSVYERKCACCGRTFSAGFRSCDAYSYKNAKEIADYRYSIHKLFCNAENFSMLKHSA